MSEFLQRVRSGEAENQIGKEAVAIQKFEVGQFGSDNAYGAGHIQNIIRAPFYDWIAADKPREFDFPD